VNAFNLSTFNRGSKFVNGLWLDHIEIRHGLQTFLALVEPKSKTVRAVYALIPGKTPRSGKTVMRKKRISDQNVVDNLIKLAKGTYV
jgi:hypothetical protein